MKYFVLAGLMLFSSASAHSPKNGHVKHLTMHKSDVIPLARAMYLEDRQHGVRGMQGVADVIFNRVRSHLSDFRNVHTISDAIRQPGQFSSWKRYYIRSINTHSKEWNEAKYIAPLVYKSYVRGIDITRGAVYYTRYDCHPRWRRSMLRTAVIGAHVMMKPRIRT